MSALRFVVAAGEAGRIDRCVGRRFPGVGRRRLAALFAAGQVRIGGRVARKGEPVAAGDEVTVAEPPARGDELRVCAEPVAAGTGGAELAAAGAGGAEGEAAAGGDRLPILYCDDALVAVAKPAGMASHPLRPGEVGTAANHLVARFPECRLVGDDPREAGLVHRLDRDTSGVLIAARDPDAHRALRERFRRHQVVKEYLALVDGLVAGPGGADAPLAQRGRRTVADPGGLPAATRWRPLGSASGRTLLLCTTSTGRMHQVRVHLALAGTPIVGDRLYGGSTGEGLGLVGHFLHAAAVALDHPRSGRPLRIVAPLDPDRRAALRALDLGVTEDWLVPS